jgi:hypothetical protein
MRNYMAEMKARGISREEAADAFPSLGIMNIRGKYVMTNGRGPFSIKGKPVIIDLDKPLPAAEKLPPLQDTYTPL